MKPTDSYFDIRKIKTLQQIEAVIEPFPRYAKRFFAAIDSSTTELTRLGYARDLNIFFDWYVNTIEPGKAMRDITLSDLGRLTLLDFEQFVAYLSHYVSPSGETVECNAKAKARKISALRRFFHFLVTHRLLLNNIVESLEMPKIRTKTVDYLSVKQSNNIRELATQGYGETEKERVAREKCSARDNAIITLFLGTGIRVSELVGLNVKDVNFREGALKVVRKGINESYVYFGKEVRSALIEYLNFRDAEKQKLLMDKTNKENIEKAKLYDNPALFLSSRLPIERIGVRAVQKLVKKYAEYVTDKKVTPHTLRRTFGSNLYSKTKDVGVVSHALGHKDLDTTAEHYVGTFDDVSKHIIRQYDPFSDPKKK